MKVNFTEYFVIAQVVKYPNAVDFFRLQGKAVLAEMLTRITGGRNPNKINQDSVSPAEGRNILETSPPTIYLCIYSFK